MLDVHTCPMPENALLRLYQGRGMHSDCYCTDLPAQVSLHDYVIALYGSRVFRLERWILGWSVAHPSTDEELAQLAAGDTAFAVWRVEKRSSDQLLLSDIYGRTRSWLMVEARSDAATRLYFGSAVVPNSASGKFGLAFRLLLPFHALYSVILLAAARARLPLAQIDSANT